MFFSLKASGSDSLTYSSTQSSLDLYNLLVASSFLCENNLILFCCQYRCDANVTAALHAQQTKKVEEKNYDEIKYEMNDRMKS